MLEKALNKKILKLKRNLIEKSLIYRNKAKKFVKIQK